MVASASQMLPIPMAPVYFDLNTEPTNTILDVYINHLDTKSANIFPGLYSYWQNEKSKIDMRIHIQPTAQIPYSFMTSMISTYIQKYEPDQFVAYLNYMLKNQARYLVPDTMSYDIAAQYLKEDVPKATNNAVTADDVTMVLSSGEFDGKTRISWKQANAARITNVPTYQLNGVVIANSTGLVTYSDWETYFNNFWNGQ